MQHSQVLAHFRDQASRMMAGDTGRIAADYAFPLPVHFPDDLAVALDQRGGSAMLEQRRHELAMRGVVGLRPNITAVELPKAGRFRVWIDWDELTALGEQSPGSSVIYYCRKAATGLRTEMIQYTHVASPGQPPRQDMNARTA